MQRRALALCGLCALLSLLVLSVPASGHATPLPSDPLARLQHCTQRQQAQPDSAFAQLCYREAMIRTGQAARLNADLKAHFQGLEPAPAAERARSFWLRALLLTDPAAAREALRDCPTATPACALLHGLAQEGEGAPPPPGAHPLPDDPESLFIQLRWALAHTDGALARALHTRLHATLREQPDFAPLADLAAAHLALSQGEFGAAAEAARRAQRAWPDSLQPWLILMRTAERGHDTLAQREALRHAVHAAPGWPALRLRWAQLLQATGRAQAAIAQLEWLLQQQGPTLPTLDALAQAHLAARQPEQALRRAQEALQLAPHAPQAQLALFESLLHLGQSKRALEIYAQLCCTQPPLDPPLALRLAESLGQLKDPALAHLSFRALLQRAPTFAPAWLAYVRWLEQRQGPRTALHVLEDAARGPAAELPAVQRQLAALYETQHQLEPALAALDRALRLDPQDTRSLDERAQLLYTLDRRAEALALWRTLAEDQPHDRAARLHLAQALYVEGEADAAHAVLEALQREGPLDPAAQRLRIEVLIALNHDAAAEEALKSAHGLTTDQRDRLRLRLALRREEDAQIQQSLEQLIARQPSDLELRMQLATHHAAALRTTEALRTYRAVLARDPGHRAAQRAYARLAAAAGEPTQPEPWPALRADPDGEALRSLIDLTDGREATVLRDEREVTIDGEGLAHVRHIRSVLIHRPEAVERLARLQLPFHRAHPPQIVRARTITPEGEARPLAPGDQQILNPHAEAQLQSDTRSLQLHFSDAEPGAILDSEVITTRPHPDLHESWWDGYILSNVDPSLRVRYRLSLPEGRAHNDFATPVMARRAWRADGHQHIEWRAGPLAAHSLKEGDLPSTATVYTSSFTDWAAVDRWYADLFFPQASLSPEVTRRAQALTAGLTRRRARIAALYSFVAENTQYLGIELGLGAYQPRSAAQTLSSAQGDCKDMTALLVALLAALDIPAYPALIRPRGQGAFIADYPSPGQFNHVILYVPDPEGDLWLDPTSGLLAIEAIPAALRGRPALIVDGLGGRRLRVPTAQAEQQRAHQRLQYTLSPTGAGEVRVQTELRGDLAGLARQQLLALPAALRDQILHSPDGLLPSGPPPEALTVSGLDQREGPLRFEAHRHDPALAGVLLSGALALPGADPSFLFEGPLPFLGPQRLLDGPRTLTRELTVALPRGYQAQAATLDWRAQEGAVAVQITQRQTGAQLKNKMVLTLEQGLFDEDLRLDLLKLGRKLQTVAELRIQPGAGFDRLRFLEAMLAEAPEDPARLFYLGQALLEAKRPEQAAERLRQSLRAGQDPQSVAALIVAPRGDDALPPVLRALLVEIAREERAPPLLRLAVAHALRAKDWPQAEELLAFALRLTPDDPRLLGLSALLLSHTGALPEALQRAEQLVMQQPQSAELHQVLGDLALRSRHLAMAERAWRQSLQLDPEQPQLFEKLALLLSQDPQRREEAREMAQRALQLDARALRARQLLRQLSASPPP